MEQNETFFDFLKKTCYTIANKKEKDDKNEAETNLRKSVERKISKGI